MPCSYFHIVLVFLFSLPFSLLAQSNGELGIGSSLRAGDGGNPWTSASSDFAFGFKQLEENQFLLSIWFNKLPQSQQAVVWHAQSGSNDVRNPVLSNKGSTIQLDAQSGLILRDPTGRLLWSTNTIVSDVARGFLDDTGNLVLSSSGNNSLWESFQNPTDTLLPSQELEIDGMLTSRRSETNFSQGRFYIKMQQDGNFLAYTKMLPTNKDYDALYYNTGTADTANPDNSGLKAVFDRRGNLYVLRRNNQTTYIGLRSLPLVSDFYHRVVLNFDGVLTQYYYPKSSSANATWTVAWTQPDNICRLTGDRGSGACGYNSFCRLDNLKRPVCKCPPTYSLVDPNDEYGDCLPDFSPSCDKSDNGSAAEDIFDIQVMTNTNWPLSDLELINPSSEEECRNACLRDCFCAVAIFGNPLCWKKKLPLSNGRIGTAPNDNPNDKVFIKYRKRVPQLLKPDTNVVDGGKGANDRGALILIGSVLFGSSVFINVLFIVTSCLGFFLIYKKKPIIGNNSSHMSLRCFTFRELEEATNGFKEELGRGAFGVVFMGVMQSGSTIAVKKLDSVARDTEKEFRTEVNAIGQTHHKNLVRLIGFCDEEQNRLLVYEYMTNGTLASFLFGDHRPSWSQRIKIAQGVARGLSYLHEECSTQIIHCDIKPQNILLDDYYNARISDFGLAKLLMLNQSRTNTGIRGTKGYVAPEWFRNTQISTKVDVYSFGVVLFEIIACRRSTGDLKVEGDDMFGVLTDWAWDCYQDGKLDELVGQDMEALGDQNMLERYVMIGLWCIQENASTRPTMRAVTQMLEGIVEVTSPPCPYPAFSTVA